MTKPEYIAGNKKLDNSSMNPLPDKTHSAKVNAHLSGWKFAIVFIILLVVVVGLVTYKQIKNAKTQVKTITVNTQVLQKRSKDLGHINRGLTGSAIDVSTGKIVKAARIFTPDDKTVYLELDLNFAPKGTVFDYIRYKEGRYVDHGELVLDKSNTQNILFNWTINNLLANIRDGKWKIVTYDNGILSKRIAYEIKNNKISRIFPESPIQRNDPDFYLKTALTQKPQGD